MRRRSDAVWTKVHGAIFVDRLPRDGARPRRRGYRGGRPRHQRCTCGCHALPRDANPPGPVTRDEL